MKLYRLALISWLFLLQFAAISNVFGQQTPKVYRLESLDHSRTVVPYKERFQYDQFIRGKVYLISGDISVARFNYSFLFNEPQFINNHNDTLALYNNNLVRFVSIGDTLFFHDNTFGYVQVLRDFDDVKLGKRQGLVSLGSDKSVGYNQYIPTAASDNVQSFTSSTGQTSKLIKKTRPILTHRTSYYFIDGNNKFYIANRGALLKIFSKYRYQVLKYLEENDVDFKNEKQLTALLSHCVGLR